jgi:hypothetical protein
VDLLVDIESGDILEDVFNGHGPGNFGWLSWTGHPGIPTLINSLTAPGDSHTYLNPNSPGDDELSVGDWVYGRSGVANAQKIREALDQLQGIDMIIPVWDISDGSGNNVTYRVVDFVEVRLLDYNLPQQNRITVQFLDYATCGQLEAVPAMPDSTGSGSSRSNGTTRDLNNPPAWPY